MAKNLTSDDCLVNITSNHLRVVVKYKDEKGSVHDDIVIDKQLYAEVDVDKSKFTILKLKVEIVLVKKNAENWPSIEFTGKVLPTAQKAAPVASVPVTEAQQNKRPKAYASSKGNIDLNNKLDSC